MYPIIGIIMRKSLSETKKDIEIAYTDIINSIIKSGGIPIGISNKHLLNYLDICNGFIIQGGDDIDEDNLKIIKLLKEKDIPTLGICLGMQEMSYLNNAKLYNIDNHNHQFFHKIIINKDSLLYSIIKKEEILVNSRHTFAVKDTNLYVSAKSEDNVIEAVEDKKNKFFLGLQWHPENMYNIDNNSKKIFDYFIKICNDCD